MFDKSNQRSPHATYSNIISLFMVIVYGTIRVYQVNISDYTEPATGYVLAVATVIIALISTYVFVKKVKNLIFLMPVIIVFGILLSFFLIDGVIIPYFFIVLYFVLSQTMSKQSRANKSQASFQTMLSSTPSMVALLDEFNRVTFISNEFAKLANIKDDRYAIGRSIFDLLPSDEMVDAIAEAYDYGMGFEQTVKMEVEDEERYFKMTFTPMKDGENGKYCEITDVTHSIRAGEVERVLLAEAFNNTLAYIVKSHVFADGDFKQVADLTSCEGCCVLNASRVGIWVFDEESMKLRAISYYDNVHENHFSADNYNQSVSTDYANLLKSERLFVINDTKQPHILSGIMDESKSHVCSLLEAVVRIGGEFVGVVSIEQIQTELYPGTREWSIDEQNFAAALADIIAISLSSSRQRALMQRNQDIMNNLPGMAYQCINNFPDFSFTFVSKGGEELTGYTADELLSNKISFFDMIHPDDVETLKQLTENSLAIGLPLETTFRIITKDGAVKWVLERSNAVQRGSEDDGKPTLIEGLYFDITNQRRAEKAEYANQAKSDFLAKMSHEIRTPMNAIMGMTEIIMRETLPPHTYEHALTIKHSGEHLLSIINDILDFSKIESGKMEIVNGDYLFHSIVSDVVSIIKLRMNNPNVSFAVYMGHDIPNNLHGDEVKVRQVLLNILSNACKYTKDGHFALEVTGTKTSDDMFSLVIRIKDTGIGIMPDDLKKLFDEFVQFDLEANRNVEGTGLGLAITKKLISLMGGSIEVHSEYGKGSEFVITLPQVCNETVEPPVFLDTSALVYCRSPLVSEYIARTLEDLQADYEVVSDKDSLLDKLAGDSAGKWDFVFAEDDLVHSALEAVKSNGLTCKIVMLADSVSSYEVRNDRDYSVLMTPVYFIPIYNTLAGRDVFDSTGVQFYVHFTVPEANILLVDDIETNLMVGEGLMKPYGASITLCSGGKDAIEALQSKDFDLVLMDHMMPEMDGIEAVRIIREMGSRDEKFAKIPIVALTANAIVGAKEMFMQSGFNDFLSKPIETAKLNDILAKWIPKEKQVEAGVAEIKSDETQITIEIDGIDASKGLKIAGGNLEGFVNLLAVYRKDGLKIIEELGQCLKTGDITLYTTHVHALKSASANIGANTVSTEAGELETAGINKDMDFIEKRNNGFVEHLGKLLESIGEFVSNNTKEPDEQVFDAELVRTKLEELAQALDSFDFDAVDEVSDELKGFTNISGIGESIREVLDDVFISRYAEAGERVREVLDNMEQAGQAE